MVPDFRFRVESSGIVLSLFGIQFENMLFLDRFLVDFSRCNSGQRGLQRAAPGAVRAHLPGHATRRHDGAQPPGGLEERVRQW